jgi:MacB-like periplasmic core domain
MSIVSCFSVRHFRLKIGLVALMAILTLAAGAGATAATVSMTHAALSNWLPGQHPAQLYFPRVPTGAPHGASSTGGETTSFSLPVFEALRRDRRVFSDVMAFAPLGNGRVSVHAGDVSEEATGEMVSGNFFSGLGVRMRLGGGFKMEDERRHTPVVVLSFAYWTHLYSRDPDVAGRTIYVQGVPFAIVGVTAEGFSGVDSGQPTDLWIPLQSRAELNPWGSSQTLYGSPNWWCLRLIARLSPGVDVQRAVAEATPGFQAAAYAGFGTPSPEDSKVMLALVPATEIANVGMIGGSPWWMLVLMALSTLLLLAACGYAVMRRARRRVVPGASA